MFALHLGNLGLQENYKAQSDLAWELRVTNVEVEKWSGTPFY